MTNIIPERTATPAELADEVSRTGQPRPRALHALCFQAARLLRCSHCGQKPGRACTDAGGVDGYHLARFVSAYVQGLITVAEWPIVLGDLFVFDNSTIVRDGAR